MENSPTTYNNCMKLASLYIVRDELRKESQYYNYNYTKNYPMMYEHGGNRGQSSSGSGSSSYGYNEPPMMYHNDDDLLIHKDMMYNQGR